MKRITQLQKEILSFIVTSIEKNGISPTIKEIMTKFSFNFPRSATYHLEKLEKAGLIIRDSKARGIKVLRDEMSGNMEKTSLVPLLGFVPCGSPDQVDQHVEDYFPVSSSIIGGRKNIFFLRASGDSMTNEKNNNGDLVLVSSGEQIKNGDSVVALLNGEVTLKKYFNLGDHVVLKPNSNNSEHKPIILKSNFAVQGKVVDVIKNFDNAEYLTPDYI